MRRKEKKKEEKVRRWMGGLALLWPIDEDSGGGEISGKRQR